MRAPRLAIAACTLAALCTVGCGGAQREKISIEPLVLLQNGSYRAARLAAEARGAKSPQDRAVIALSFFVWTADFSSDSPDAAEGTIDGKAVTRAELETMLYQVETLAILDGFSRHYALFRYNAQQAKTRYEAGDWHGIRRLARENPQARIVVMGCYATRAPDEVAKLPGVSEVLTDKREIPDLLMRHGVSEKFRTRRISK